ncbi:MAG: hypothetical protein N3A58_02595 [Spirochaetes bacterium]|nr:hypothetical protein [Spirochaetota bacterium]
MKKIEIAVENFDFLFGFETKKCKKFIKKLIFNILFCNNLENIKIEILKNKEKLGFDLYNFLKFLIYFKEKDISSAINLVDQYFTSEYNEDYYFSMIIYLYFLGIRLYDEIIFRDEIKNTIFLSIKYYFEGLYKESYEKLLILKNKEKYATLVEVLIFLNMIKLKFFNEAEKKIKILYKSNRKNPYFIFLISELFVKIGEYYKAYKIYKSNIYLIINNEKLRKNFLFISRKINKMDKYTYLFLNYNNIIKFTEEEIFEMGLFFHEKGDLKLACDCYKKVNPKKFPVNKMFAIVGLQTNNFKLFSESIENEKNIRGEDFELVKMNKLLSYSDIWS